MGAAEDWIKQQLADQWVAEQLNGAPQGEPAPAVRDISDEVRESVANDGHAQQIAGSMEGAETELRDIGYIRDAAPAPAPKPTAAQRPWYQGLLESGADSGLGALNGVTLGYYDEIKGLLEGDAARDALTQRQQLAQRRSPVSYGLGNAIGTALPAAGLSIATGSPVAGATLASGISGSGNAQSGERVSGAGNGAALGLLGGAIGKGVQQLGRIPTATGEIFDDLANAATSTGGMAGVLRGAVRSRLKGAGSAAKLTGNALDTAGSVGIEATAPLISMGQSRNVPQPSKQGEGFGNLTGQAASVVTKIEPALLGVYAPQFQELDGDPRKQQELVTRLTATDQFFRTQILPKLQQTTTKGFQP